MSLLAFFLLLTAIANIGCCGSTGCAVDFKTEQKTKEDIYEELDAKK